MNELSRVVVVGTGLVGTSIALALRSHDVAVDLFDQDAAAMRLAGELGAGTPWPDSVPAAGRGDTGPADLAVLAMPAGAVASALSWAQDAQLAHVYTDVGSVKQQPLAQAEELGCELETFVGGHPLAGRERSGPAAARADLFHGRPWVLCPSTENTTARETAMDAARALVRACGGEPVLLDPASHDSAVAIVSHVPHVVASAAAARLRHADPAALSLAGQGLRDTTRVAAGDADLWAGILGANAAPVAGVLDALISDLQDLSTALHATAAPESREGGAAAGPAGPAGASRELASDAVAGLLRRGQDGRSLVPGKRGGPAPDYTVVPVVIKDMPGELGRLFAAAGEAGVNVEDVALEHSPGLPVGVVELSVRPAVARLLTEHLRAAGWSVHS